MPDQLSLPLPVPDPAPESPAIPELEPAEVGPIFKPDEAARWRLWRIYEELDYCAPDRVPVLRRAIAYLGGSLEVRFPVPASIDRQVGHDIPVRRV